MAILQTRELGKSYGDLTAVRSLDLEVEAGEIFGLLGPNGAGKTTTISMICGVITPSHGTATVAGHDIRKDAFAARRALGLVPQDLALYEELSPRQNLAYFGRMYGLGGALLSERIDWALDVAGLADRARDQVSTFSGGMKRRLNLVTGLLHKPALLVLDEPTVGVDPQSRNHLFQTVRALRDDHDMTVIYTSHYMEEVEALCERVAIMDHGQLIALDRVENMVKAHAQTGIEVQVEGDVEAALAAVIQAIGGDRADADSASDDDPPATREGDTIRVHGDARWGAVVTAIEATDGAHLRAIRSRESDLESVFLSLTGKRLRDT